MKRKVGVVNICNFVFSKIVRKRNHFEFRTLFKQLQILREDVRNKDYGEFSLPKKPPAALVFLFVILTFFGYIFENRLYFFGKV